MIKLVICSVLAMWVLASCNLVQGGEATATVAPVDALRTSAAKTVDALSTSLAMNKTIVPSATLPAITRAVNSPTGVVQTVLPSATVKPAASLTPLPPSATALPCDQGAFVKDITVPDGTFFYPNTVFTKTWELKNVGSCTWNSNYQLVFFEGNSMKAVASKPLVAAGTTVAPNQVVQVSVEMTAPDKTGKVESYWKLKNPAGVVFGVGAGGSKAFWISLNVAEKFTMIQNLCSAEWRNGSTLLACPLKLGEKAGSVLKVDAPKFSSGYVEDEPGILMVPEAVIDGVIVGKFPPMLVPAKSFFQTLVVCAFDSPKCDAKVVLTYQVGGDAEKTLVELVKKAENDASPIKIDLTEKGLVGKTVVFRLYVRANGSATDDRIYWINPSLNVIP